MITIVAFTVLPILFPMTEASPNYQQYVDGFGFFKAVRLPQLPIGNDGCYCPPAIRPVCGSSGPVAYTYMNECVLRCTKGVELLYDGPCCSSKVCSPYAAPVCDSENMMYRSPCAFEEAQCFSHRILSRHLSMDSSAPACSCIESCEEEWAPVCDSSGKTHPSACIFRNVQCFMRERHQEHIEIAHFGQCCADVCRSGGTDSTSSFSLCDSTGRSHADLCSYYRTRCEARLAAAATPAAAAAAAAATDPADPVTIAHFGPCSSMSSRLTNSYLNSILLKFARDPEQA